MLALKRKHERYSCPNTQKHSYGSIYQNANRKNAPAQRNIQNYRCTCITIVVNPYFSLKRYNQSCMTVLNIQYKDPLQSFLAIKLAMPCKILLERRNFLLEIKILPRPYSSQRDFFNCNKCCHVILRMLPAIEYPVLKLNLLEMGKPT